MKVKDVLTDESKWIQGFPAKDANETICNYSAPEAVKFCLMGAVGRCYGPLKNPPSVAIAKRIEAYLKAKDPAFCHPSNWNDYEAEFADIKQLVETLDI